MACSAKKILAMRVTPYGLYSLDKLDSLAQRNPAPRDSALRHFIQRPDKGNPVSGGFGVRS